MRVFYVKPPPFGKGLITDIGLDGLVYDAGQAALEAVHCLRMAVTRAQPHAVVRQTGPEAGPRQRGLALGFNEAAGYGAVALTAVIAGCLAARYGLRPAPFLLGLSYAVISMFQIGQHSFSTSIGAVCTAVMPS